MSFNIADYINVNTDLESPQASGGRSVRSGSPAFANVFFNYLPNTRTTFADEVRVHSEERRAALGQLLDRMRAESDMRRQELLSKLLSPDETPSDIIGKSLDIARRIMRGEKVSPEEMRFLGKHFPKLLFQALLFRDGEVEEPEGDNVLSGDGEESAPAGIDGHFVAGAEAKSLL